MPRWGGAWVTTSYAITRSETCTPHVAFYHDAIFPYPMVIPRRESSLWSIYVSIFFIRRSDTSHKTPIYWKVIAIWESLHICSWDQQQFEPPCNPAPYICNDRSWRLWGRYIGYVLMYVRMIFPSLFLFQHLVADWEKILDGAFWNRHCKLNPWRNHFFSGYPFNAF